MRGSNVKSSLVAMVIAATGYVTARADTLQVRGYLTIRNTSDKSWSLVSDLPGGYKFVFEIRDPDALPRPLGLVALTPSFWPEPGGTFSGPFIINMRSPGPGRIDDEPLLVDGMKVLFRIRAFVEPTRIDVRGEEYQPIIQASDILPALGVPVNTDIRGG